MPLIAPLAIATELSQIKEKTLIIGSKIGITFSFQKSLIKLKASLVFSIAQENTLVKALPIPLIMPLIAEIALAPTLARVFTLLSARPN
ncbi:MAG TPA: hypothetical protein DCM10_09815, partial [Xanthomarina gelatinilytica]|nr:hypothetical protein [Xanthomarina gelatinilytica]